MVQVLVSMNKKLMDTWECMYTAIEAEIEQSAGIHQRL